MMITYQFNGGQINMYLVINGYCITEDGYYSIDSDEYKQLIEEIDDD